MEQCVRHVQLTSDIIQEVYVYLASQDNLLNLVKMYVPLVIHLIASHVLIQMVLLVIAVYLNLDIIMVLVKLVLMVHIQLEEYNLVLLVTLQIVQLVHQMDKLVLHVPLTLVL